MFHFNGIMLICVAVLSYTTQVQDLDVAPEATRIETPAYTLPFIKRSSVPSFPDAIIRAVNPQTGRSRIYQNAGIASTSGPQESKTPGILTTYSTTSSISNDYMVNSKEGNQSRYSVGYVGCPLNNVASNLIEPEEIDASAYNHIIFSYAEINIRNELVLRHIVRDGDYLRRLVTHVKMNNPGIKVMISVGGFSYTRTSSSHSLFFHLTKNYYSSKSFINSIIMFMQKYDLDGVDFDMETSEENRKPYCEDGHHYILFLKQLRKAFSYRYSISACIFNGGTTSIPGLNVADMVVYLNFITVMAYDLHGIREYRTSKYPRMLPHTDMREVHFGLQILIKLGVPKQKLLLGLAFWGHVYKQLDPEQDEIGSLYIDPDVCLPLSGLRSRVAEYLGYNEIKDIITNKDEYGVRTFYHHQPSVTNVLTYGNDQWLTFDDPTTISWRVRYAKNYGLGGVAARFIDLDDENNSMSNAIRDVYD